MDDLIATYYFRPRDGVTADFAAQAISEEQTTGTWTNLSTVNDHTAYVHAYDGEVMDIVSLRDGGYVTRIRYPYEIFEPGNIPQYLSVIAGNLFGLGKLEAVRLLDIDLPDAFRTVHPGPKFGIEVSERLWGPRSPAVRMSGRSLNREGRSESEGYRSGCL